MEGKIGVGEITNCSSYYRGNRAKYRFQEVVLLRPSRSPSPPLDIIVEIPYTFYDFFVMRQSTRCPARHQKGCNLHMFEYSKQWHHYC